MLLFIVAKGFALTGYDEVNEPDVRLIKVERVQSFLQYNILT